ncbi:S16 family serine protease [Luteolibacter algae]|uniref:S16 family serine protease n=1 Tax=Luteolibacter algae TaxID=454151 RepID=A0ABW5D9B6_9BACT
MKFLVPTLILFLSVIASAEAPALLQASLKGLLVVELDNGKIAGTASQMNATAVKNGGSQLEIVFNQEVGEDMRTATKEVSKFIHVRHDGKLPEGYRIELAFADKYSPKDGPSAAVASALLVDSMIVGNELADDFAVTGDMNADGHVQPVGGVPAKISGAQRKGCKIVAVPSSNESAVSDAYIVDGLAALKKIQIFSIADFEEARAISSKERDENLAKAISEFSKIQEVLARDEKFISNSKVIEKLREVVTISPNHLSAKYLLLHAVGQAPRSLTLAGSIEAINKADTALAGMLSSGSFTISRGNSDLLFKFESEMIRLRPLLDKRTIDFSDSYIELAEFVRDNRDRKIFTPQLQRELDGAVSKISYEQSALLGDADVREELMLE